MDKDELTETEQAPTPTESAPGSGFMVGALFLMFAIVEILFLVDLHTLFSRQVQSGFLIFPIALQLSLIVSRVCFWRLWRNNFVIRVGRANQNFFTIYLSLAMLALLSSLLLFREIGLEGYKANQLSAP